VNSFRDHGIELPFGASGEVRVTCPQCTPHRKPGNQRERDLAVNVDSQTWLCHHCGWSGGLSSSSADDKPKSYRRPEYPESWLALPSKVQEFFCKRGISPETCAACSVGYQPGNNGPGAITFPRIKGGEVVAIKFRTHDKKFWQSKDPEPCFWNYDGAAKAGGDTLVIVEGEMDGLACIEAGIPAVVSVPNGAPALNAKDVTKHLEFVEADKALLEKFSHIVLFVDSDAPGQALENHLAERIGKHRCLRVSSRPADCKDANDILLKHGAEQVRGLILRAKPYPIDGLYGVDDVSDAVCQFYGEGVSKGLSTGWKTLDEFYTVIPGYWTLVTGIPSHGKSSVIDALAINLWNIHRWKFAFCSPESLPIYRHVASLSEKIARRPFSVGYSTNPRMTETERDNTLKRMAGEFHFCMLEDISVDGILDVMQAAVSRHGVKGIVLDPWNELEYHRPPRMSETEYISLALGKIRRFSRQNNVHVWLIAHPVKMKAQEDGSYPVPRPYDVSGSAHFANKADNCLSVFRRDLEKPETEIHVQKIRPREVGKIGSVTLGFDRTTCTFSDLKNTESAHYQEREEETDEVPF
jgi:twinkle protein